MKAPLVATAALVLLLAGCASPTPAATPAPSASAPAAPASALLPGVGPALTAAEAQEEGVRLADELQSLVDAIINVDDKSQLVPADGDTAAYYGVYRTLSLQVAADPLVMGAQLASVLEQSGWSLYESTTENGQFLAALSSGDTGWFAIIGGDDSVEGQSVVTFQIASPDIL